MWNKIISRLSLKAIVFGSLADIVSSRVVSYLFIIPVTWSWYAEKKSEFAGFSHDQWREAVTRFVYGDPSIVTTLVLISACGTIFGGYVVARTVRHDQILNMLLSLIPGYALAIYAILTNDIHLPVWLHAILFFATPFFACIGVALGMLQNRGMENVAGAQTLRPPAAVFLPSNDIFPAGNSRQPGAIAARIFRSLKNGLKALFFCPVDSETFSVDPIHFSLLGTLLLVTGCVVGYFEYGVGSVFYAANISHLVGGIGVVIMAALPAIWGRKGGQSYLRLPALAAALLISYLVLLQPIPWIVWKEKWGGESGSTAYYVLRDLGDIWLAGAFFLAARRISRPNASLQTFLILLYAIGMPWILSAFPMTAVWSNSAAAAHEAARDDRNLRLLYSEDIFQLEPKLFQKEVEALKPERPGYTDLYFLGIAPYSFQDVFMKEVKTVGDVFAANFGTAGRSMLLINNMKTLDSVPMATNAHIHDALMAIGKRMDRSEDILVLYLTSHGSKENGLAMNLAGLRMKDLAPDTLKSMLDDSGIKWRIVIVSGCHSGIFVPELKDDHTLVITASDADHMSYGCSDEGDMTDFARTLVTGHLAKSHDFIAAFEAAKADVNEDEKDRKLVHSNPQMAVGDAMRKKLAELQKRLDASKTQ